jgi:hypothetical protein
MQHHDARLRRIQELCDLLSRAVETSFRVRESAQELRAAVEEILQVG